MIIIEITKDREYLYRNTALKERSLRELEGEDLNWWGFFKFILIKIID